MPYYIDINVHMILLKCNAVKLKSKNKLQNNNYKTKSVFVVYSFARLVFAFFYTRHQKYVIYFHIEAKKRLAYFVHKAL